MIDIQIEPKQFEYDIQSMVQAFYVGQPFKINEDLEESYRTLKVIFQEEKITASLYDEAKKLFEDEICCDFQDRRETKNALKKLLYCLMRKDIGQDLPWGNLTGIRPAKIPGMLKEQGLSDEAIRKEMKETYFISDNKLDLAMDVSNMEDKVLSNVNYKGNYSLYVGIPFCPTTCLYCSFTSYPLNRYKEKVDAYVDSVIKELRFLGKQLQDKELNSVYIGGGTPTTLEPAQLDRLINALKDNFDFSNVKEFTVEAGRPDSITRDKLMTLKKQNVSRISINPQTMNQETLDIIGRKHSVKQVIQAFNLARDYGMDNINMDFIIGLPNETEDMVKYSMEQALKLAPDGITVHSLALKRGSRLNMNRQKYSDLNFDNNTKLMDITKEYAYEMGMKPYYLYRQKNMAGNQENVGYSLPGKEGIYNILMMGDYQNVWACGAGAVTKLLSSDRKSATRIDTLKNVDQYIDRIDEMIERKRSYFVN